MLFLANLSTKTTLIIKILVMEKKFSTPLGNVYLYASEVGLVACSFSRKKTKAIKTNKAKKHLDSAQKALESYFKTGKLKLSSINFATNGTEFQNRVWKELRKIKPGKTISYGELAKKVGSPKAARAAGSACGKNPFLIFNPCHRVISADGSLGGFAAGIEIKEELLKFEQKHLK